MSRVIARLPSPFRAFLAPIASLLYGPGVPPGAEGSQSNVDTVLDKVLRLADTEDRLKNQCEILVRAAREATQARKVAEAASKAKSGFLADMSHELRTPLNAIIGIAEILIEDAKEDDATDRLEPLQRILGAGEHLLHLINDVLDLSKIEAGKMHLAPETIDLRGTLDEVVATAASLAEKRASRLLLDCEAGIDAVYADPLRLKQVLLNLVGNACKFTKDGEVRLSAHCDGAGAARRLIVAVEDTGIGMTDEQVGRIFQEYAQADTETTRKYGGTGLGLVISRRLAQLMGGDIQVASRLNEGSTFTFWLPIGEKRAEIHDGRA